MREPDGRILFVRTVLDGNAFTDTERSVNYSTHVIRNGRPVSKEGARLLIDAAFIERPQKTPAFLPPNPSRS